MERKVWSREETIVVLALYHQIPFAETVARNRFVIKIANALGRSPAAVAMKLGNLGALDKTLRAQNIVGLTHTSQTDKEVWAEFEHHLHDLIEASNEILRRCAAPAAPPIACSVGQFFTSAVFSNYHATCCMTGIRVAGLLSATRIKPEAECSPEELADPSNGICLNALHQRAFERGFITVTPGWRVRVSSVLRHMQNLDSLSKELLLDLDQQEIALPDRLQPKEIYLEYHNDTIFQR